MEIISKTSPILTLPDILRCKENMDGALLCTEGIHTSTGVDRRFNASHTKKVAEEGLVNTMDTMFCVESYQ